MELDAKSAAMLFAAIAGGQTVGAGGGAKLADVMSPDSVGGVIAGVEARVTGLEKGLKERVVEAAGDHSQTREMLNTATQAINDRITTGINALDARIGRLDARITRLDERKMDK